MSVLGGDFWDRVSLRNFWDSTSVCNASDLMNLRDFMFIIWRTPFKKR